MLLLVSHDFPAADGDEDMSLFLSSFVIIISTVSLVIYFFTDEAFAAVAAIWILLLWIFVNGVKQ